WKAYEMLQKAPKEEEIIDIGQVKEADPDSFTITRDTEDADFEVKGKNIERLVAMTNFDNDEALYRFQLIWRRLGIEQALKDKGIEEGQSVKIGDMIFDYKEHY
ncbi:MAG: Obg family GTPase CgtA, partial [Acidaminococcus sp.]|nr:Obg family GTPase CgtA [Acidaminococcus sp.]